jgi:hypothetical protein
MYFDQFHRDDWEVPILQLSERIVRHLGVAHTRLVYWPENSSNWRSRHYVYRPSNLKKLEKVLASTHLALLWLLSLRTDDWVPDPDYYLLADAEKYELKPYRCFHLGINTRLIPSLRREALWPFMPSVVTELEHIADVRYGLVHIMPHDKSPFDYFEDNPSSENLTSAEKANLEQWRWGRQGSLYQSLMRDVYWGNLITLQHCPGYSSAQDLATDIQAAIPGVSVSLLSDEKLFFSLPLDMSESECEMNEAVRMRARQALEKLGINIMPILAQEEPPKERTAHRIKAQLEQEGHPLARLLTAAEMPGLIEGLRTRLGCSVEELDLSPESLIRLEDHLVTLYEMTDKGQALTDVDLMRLIREVAAYLAQVLLLHGDGEWLEGPRFSGQCVTIKWPGGSQVLYCVGNTAASFWDALDRPPERRESLERLYKDIERYQKAKKRATRKRAKQP